MIRNPSLISEIHHSCKTELQALSERKDLSSYSNVHQLLGKSLLLSCASFYEDEVVRIVRRILANGGHPACVQTWLDSAAIEGQFYKWFDFRNAKNTNRFLSTFGTEFRENMRQLLDTKARRKKAERDFLDLCQKRNECVHHNYAAYSLDLTIQEIYDKHKSAMSYIRMIDYGMKKWILTVQEALSSVSNP